MSFQDKVFQEILHQDTPPGRVQLAQLAAIVQCTGTIRADAQGEPCLVLHCARPAAITKGFTLLEKTFNITGVSARNEESDPAKEPRALPQQAVLEGEAFRRVSDALLLPDADGGTLRLDSAVPDRFLKDRRCVRSYLAGAFLCIGTVRDPAKEYYLSFDVLSEEQARQTLSLLDGLNLIYHDVRHARSRAIVARDSDVIVDTLNLLGAHVSMMDMENARIVRQVRGGVNRKVNCETANIMKTVAASQRQLEEIQRIQKSPVWDTLPDSLRQIALLREQYPESSLQELGGMLEPPIGKSGVNHRLRRLSAIAQELEEQQKRQEGGSETFCCAISSHEFSDIPRGIDPQYLGNCGSAAVAGDVCIRREAECRQDMLREGSGEDCSRDAAAAGRRHGR